MDEGSKQALLGAVRYVIMLAGTSLIAKGWLPASIEVNELAGAIMIIAPFVWSTLQKYESERKSQVRETTAVQAGAEAARTGAIAGVASAAIGPSHAQNIIATMKESL